MQLMHFTVHTKVCLYVHFGGCCRNGPFLEATLSRFIVSREILSVLRLLGVSSLLVRCSAEASRPCDALLQTPGLVTETTVASRFSSDTFSNRFMLFYASPQVISVTIYFKVNIVV